jgi:hypothetical protein
MKRVLTHVKRKSVTLARKHFDVHPVDYPPRNRRERRAWKVQRRNDHVPESDTERHETADR